MELRGRSVLVTGATGGLGQAIARRLRLEGCELTVSGRRADVLDALAEEVGGRALAADLSDPDDLARVGRECSGVDVLVANAGLPGSGELADYSVEQLDQVLAVNLRSPIVLTRTLGESMLARGSGHVVLISSLAGKSATPVSSMYHATKFGLRGFALALRQDWEPRGVGVSCVNPGPIAEVGMVHGSGVAQPAGFRPRSPQDVAAAVVRAVKRNKAEIDVADPVMKAGATFGLLAPRTTAWLARLADGR